MFCLFKNSHLYPKVNFFLVAAAWVGVVIWLNFTFIEKELIFKLIAGDAILVDLLFGLPLVLMLAVVVYATIYWFLKLVIVYLFPQAIMPASEFDTQSELAEDPELEEALQAKYGDEYWQNEHENENKNEQACYKDSCNSESKDKAVLGDKVTSQQGDTPKLNQER